MGHTPPSGAPVVRVDAASGRGRATYEEDAVQPTCFGIWRRKAKPLPVKQLSPREPGDKDVAPTGCDTSPQGKGARGVFSSSAIMKSFQAIGIDTLREPGAPSPRPAGGKARVTCTPFADAGGRGGIMASYGADIHETSIHETRPDLCETQDLDAHDGAASIEEEDTFGTPSWSVDPHDIYFVSRGDASGKICRLGKGEYGPVYLGVWQEQEVAIKLARQKPLTLRQERAFQRAAARLHALAHPNLVQFVGACCWKGGKRSVLVTEYMDRGDLRRLLAREELTAKFAWVRHGRTVALDIAHGLAHLHSRGVAHGRLSSANVLMNRAGVAKLADACLPQLLSHCRPERGAAAAAAAAGPDLTLAPEVREGGEASQAADVYSLGVLLWELLSMEAPSGSLRPIRTPEESPAAVAYLVECCLSRDPARRPSAAQALATIKECRK